MKFAKFLGSPFFTPLVAASADRKFNCSFPTIIIFSSLHGLITGILYGLHISEVISFPFESILQTMNSKDLEFLLAIYDKCTTEKTSMIKPDSVTILFYDTLPVCEGSEKRTVGRCATIMNKPRVGRIQYLITKFYEIKLHFTASHGKTSYFGMFLLNFIYTCIFCFLSAYIVAKDLYLCAK